MRLPRGNLVRSRVVDGPGVVLDAVLDASLTGYAVLEPQDTLLLDDEARGVLTFEDGVPVLAYHTGADRGGPAALADLAQPGPYRVELYELPADALADVHAVTELRVPPAEPAVQLAGDDALAARTREAAPASRADEAASSEAADPVVAFLADEEKLAAIREQAREEARARADAWGLRDHLEE